MQTWIGLVHVRPRPENHLLSGAIGAFVPAVASAEDEDEFVSKVVDLLHEYQFDVLEVKDIEPLRQRLGHANVDPEVLHLAASLSAKNPVALSSFEAYEAEQ